MTDSMVLPIVLMALSLAGAIEALRCLADHLLASALMYTAVALGLAVVAAKAALDAV